MDCAVSGAHTLMGMSTDGMDFLETPFDPPLKLFHKKHGLGSSPKSGFCSWQNSVEKPSHSYLLSPCCEQGAVSDDMSFPALTILPVSWGLDTRELCFNKGLGGSLLVSVLKS